MRVTFHRRCGPTGRRLRDALGGIDTPWMLNWGVVNLSNPPEKILNRPEAVALASNKLEALRAMAEAEAPIPPTTDDLWTAAMTVSEELPLVGRTTNHRAGSGLWICRTTREIEDSYYAGATHWLHFIDAVHEYRVHFVCGKVVKTSEKLGGEGVIRSNSAHGWRFKAPTTSFEERKPVRRAARKACRALGVDIGAVDILVDAAGKVYVTEVNTAPSLKCKTSTTFDRYVEAITNHVQEGAPPCV